MLRRGVFSVVVMASGAALAQSSPDAGRLLQETRPIPPVPVVVPQPALDKAQQASPEPVQESPGGDIRVQVTRFKLVGNQALSLADFAAVLTPWENRSLNFGELMQVVEAIEDRYKSSGYFLAQAYLAPQQIRSGEISINVSEGLLGEARLEGESRVLPEVMFAHLDKLPAGQALKLPVLERQILLINELAGGTSTLDLQAGEVEGSSDVVLMQSPEDAVTGRFEVNNHGASATGVHRVGATVNANSYFGRGERITLYGMASDTSNLAVYNLRGDLPIGGDGWRVTAALTRVEYAVGGAFASLGMRGTADATRLGLAYPLIRSAKQNLKLTAELDQTDLNDSNAPAPAKKQIDGLTLTFNADQQDQWFGGGQNRADLVLRTGQFKFPDQGTTTEDAKGTFAKASLTLSRQQTLGQTLSLSAQVMGQQSNKNLASAEKMSLGGPTMLPGYASGADGYGVADAGLYAKLGLRWQAAQTVALSPFVEQARVRLARDPVDATDNHRNLADYGVTVDWSMDKNFSLSATVARATKKAVKDDGAIPTLWVSLGMMW